MTIFHIDSVFAGEPSVRRPAEHTETYLASMFNFRGIARGFVVAGSMLVSPEEWGAALAQTEAQNATF